MKTFSYICALITAMYIIVPTAKDIPQDLEMASPPVVEEKPYTMEVEKRMREIELLKSQIRIELKEVAIDNVRKKNKNIEK